MQSTTLSVAEHAARRRQQKEDRLEQLVTQAHSWGQAELDEAADLADQLGKDLAEIDQRCQANRQAHADRQQQERLKADWIQAAELLAKAQHRHDALALVVDPAEWERAARATFARTHADMGAFVTTDRNVAMDMYLHATGWINSTLGGWNKAGRRPVQLVAVHEQFVEDLKPVIPAIEALASSVPDTVAPERIERADIEAIKEKLAAIPPVDPTIERFIAIATAGKAVYLDGLPEMQRAKVAADLNQHLSPFRGRFVEKLRELRNANWSKPQPAFA